MTSEHRRRRRHPVHFRLVFDDGRSYQTALVDDISETGLLLEAPTALKVGSVVRLEPVDPIEDALFEVKARVVRCFDLDAVDTTHDHHGLVGVGLEFLEIDEDTERAISKMIAALEAREAEAPHDPFLG